MGGCVAMFGSAVYAECGIRLPKTGGFYVYYREVYGPALAFVGGWAALLITYPASIAAIALVFAAYLREALPGIFGSDAVPAAIALAAVGAINLLGVRTSGRVQRLLTGVKIAAVLAVVLAAVAAFHPSTGDAVSAPPIEAAAPFSMTALLGGLVVLLWTYDGWSDVSLVTGEIREPGRVLGKAVLLGTGVMAVLYITVQISVGVLLPQPAAAASSRVVAEAVAAGLGSGSGRLVAGLVVLCTLGSMHGIILTASRAGFAMARDGAFFRWFGAAHPRFRSPARAVALVTAASIFYVFAAGFRNLLGFFSFSVWIFYGLTAAGLLALRRRGAGEPVPWRTPGGALAPMVVLAVAASMTAGLMIESPGRSITGLGMLLAGFPVFAIWKRLYPR